MAWEPPEHPNCRSTVVPAFEVERYGRTYSILRVPMRVVWPLRVVAVVLGLVCVAVSGWLMLRVTPLSAFGAIILVAALVGFAAAVVLWRSAWREVPRRDPVLGSTANLMEVRDADGHVIAAMDPQGSLSWDEDVIGGWPPRPTPSMLRAMELGRVAGTVWSR